jgi:hypothetical protein
MGPQAHTDKVFEAELGALRDKLLDMGGRVEAALSASVRALVERDSALAEKVKQQDREINRLEGCRPSLYWIAFRMTAPKTLGTRGFSRKSKAPSFHGLYGSLEACLS